jgi:hypothetical protein
MAGKYSEAAWKALASELISFKGRLLKRRLRFFSDLQFVLSAFGNKHIKCSLILFPVKFKEDIPCHISLYLSRAISERVWI